MRMKFFFALICLLALAYVATPASIDKCTFEIIVKTGDKVNAGTDSRISLQVRGKTGPTLSISNLQEWGGSQGPHYFERGDADRFRGAGPCLSGTPCKIVLTSSGTGNNPAWYVNYVQVTQYGRSPPDLSRWWHVEQWLAPSRRLSDIRNNC